MYQNIVNGEVYNLHPLGREIQEFSISQIHLLPGHGFMDGGCLAFAKGMMACVIGIQAKLICAGRDQVCDHVSIELTTRDGLIYLDVDGLATQGELLTKMMKVENISNPVIHNYIGSDLLVDYCEIGVPRTITANWISNYGPITPDRVSGDWL